MLPMPLVRPDALPRRFLALGLVLLQAAVAGELLADPACAEHRTEHASEIGEAASHAHHYAAHHHDHAHAHRHQDGEDTPRPDRHGDHEACICVGVSHAANAAALPSPGETAGEDTISRGPLGAGTGTGIIPIAPAFLLPFATAPPVSR